MIECENCHKRFISGMAGSGGTKRWNIGCGVILAVAVLICKLVRHIVGTRFFTDVFTGLCSGDFVSYFQNCFFKLTGSILAWSIAWSVLAMMVIDILRGVFSSSAKRPYGPGFHMMIFRFHGAPVYLHWSVLLLAIGPLVFQGDWPTRIILSAVVILSMLLHELSHAGVGHDCGNHVRSVTVTWVGGLCRFDHDAIRHPALVSFAGPFCNLVLAFVFYVVGRRCGLGNHIAIRFGTIFNLYISLLNILPGLPFDGGRIWNALLSRIFPTHHLLVAFVGGLIAVSLLAVNAVYCFYGGDYVNMVFFLLCVVIVMLFSFVIPYVKSIDDESAAT